MTKRLRSVSNGRGADKAATMPSLHFTRPVMGPRGVEVSVVFADEAEWGIKFHEIRVATPQPVNPLEIGARPPVVDVMRIPVWEVAIFEDGKREERRDGERMTVLTVDMSQAYVRIPHEYVDGWLKAGDAARRRADLAASLARAAARAAAEVAEGAGDAKVEGEPS